MGKVAGGRAKLFEQYDEHVEKDHDPEADHIVASESDESGDENAGTEHYVSVGKSKLRAKGEGGAALGPQYRGSKVSRERALEAESSSGEDEDEDDDGEEYDDPETADLEADAAAADSDSEINSDDALGESDREKLSKFVFRGSSQPRKSKGLERKRASAADYMSDSGEDEDEGSIDDGLGTLIDGEAEEDDEDDEDDEDEDEDDDNDDDEEEEEEEEDEYGGSDSDEKERERNTQAKAKPAINGKLPNADIEKGIAIQKQRRIYDGLLNMRIRLQKALIAANSFPEFEDNSEQDDITTESYEAAEAAAIDLLEMIGSLRENCGVPVAAGNKRKRATMEMTSAQIWEQLGEDDGRAVKLREKCLDKWSRKVQSVNVTAAPKGLGARNKTLVDSLHDQLNDPEKRLVRRTRVPRSCAPAQAARKMSDDDEGIFDDADFYQLLLKELVEQRTVDARDDKQTSAVPAVVVAASRDNRMRKTVDRKASKGRKMRFTVHEKLQNFMASEDRRSWEQNAIDRFFGTLFGRKLELDEADEDEDMDDAVASNFKLFA